MIAAWQTKNLADVCTFFADGDWVESKDQAPGGIRLIQTGNVGFGEFKDRSDKARYISPSTFKRLRCTEIFAGDCLISRLPDPVGRSCILPETGEEMITAVDCTIARFDHSIIFPSFFNLYAQSTDYLTTVDSETTGTTRKRISRKKLGMVPVPVPSLPEQRRIVGILDEAFEGIAKAAANTEANLNNARELFESHLNTIFSNPGPDWVKTTIGECIKIRSGDFLPAKKMDATGNIDVYGGNGIAGKHNASNLIGENIIIGRVGAKCGNVRYVTGDIWLTDNAFCIADYYKDFDLRFLAVLLDHLNLRQFANQAAQPVISYKTIKPVALAFPNSVSKQQAIVAKINELATEAKRLEVIYRQKLALLAELKQSLLHKAFSGEL